MKITKIETLMKSFTHGVALGREELDRPNMHLNWVWVRLHTDAGIVGLGETLPLGEPEVAVVHDVFGRFLLGRNPLEIERIWQNIYRFLCFSGSGGSEMRALSAVDIALWDILGKHTGQPIYQLLGGSCRDRIPIYNTCVETQYDFNKEAGKLARDLLSSGIRAMKIWPFDSAAAKTDGQYISLADLDRCLQPFKQIREAVGNEMDIAVELHGNWAVTPAARIAHALEPYGVLWLEDALALGYTSGYRALAKSTRIPLNISERVMTQFNFEPFLAEGIVGVVDFDIDWCGGISQARKIATMAEAHSVPFTVHNCGGPIVSVASMHIAASQPNLMIMESVRKFYQGLFPAVITHNPLPIDGFFPLPKGPGLGTDLKPEVWSMPDVQVRETTA
jgi:galactonate dehydratase